MNEKLNVLLSNGIITVDDLKRMTTLELILMIIDKVNQLTNNVNGLDESIKEVVKELLSSDDIKAFVSQELIPQVSKAVIPMALDHARGIKTFPCRDGAGKPFTQGFAINQERDELYVSRQLNGGTEVEIHIWKFSTMTKVGVKSYTKSTGAYQEGCPYFINENGQRVFLVRPNYNQKLCHFNWDTGVRDEAPFDVLGGSKVSIDNQGRYLITSMGDASRLEGVYLYDLSSIKTKTPLLIASIRFPMGVINDEKTQGLTMIDDVIYLSQGKADGTPCITAINLDGQVIKRVELDKHDLATKMDGITLDVTQYENEGIYHLTQNGISYPVINHIFNLDTCALMVHGELGADTVKQGRNVIYSNELVWKDLPLESGVEPYAEDVKPQYAKDDRGMVYLRGVVKHAQLVSESGNTVILSTLGYPYKPERNCFFHTVASGWADKQNRIECYKNGQIVLKDTNSGSTSPFTCLDGISFMSEQS